MAEGRRVLLLRGANQEPTAAMVRGHLVAHGLAVLDGVIDESGRWRRGSEHLRPFDAAADVDLAFPLGAGAGADSAVLALLELSGLPYVGSPPFTAALVSDRAVMRAVLGQAGLVAPPWRLVTRPELGDLREVLDRLEGLGPYPRIVRPARRMSATPARRATDDAGLVRTLALGARTDQRLVVEAGVGGRMLLCALVAAPDGLRVSVVREVGAAPGAGPGGEPAAALDAASAPLLSAPLEPGVEAEARALAAAAFAAVQARDLALVSLLHAGDGRLLVCDVTLRPELGPDGAYLRLWQLSGLAAPALVVALAEAALGRLPTRPGPRAESGAG